MAKIIDKQRYTCALGAINTVHAINRVIPILHSGPGCSGKLSGGGGSSGYFSPNIYPCSSVSEKEVVFGGENKLRDTIQNALKVIDADLFVVMSGCTSEIIGDDIGKVTREFQEKGYPIVYANTPGFKGSNLVGHDWVLTSIFDQYIQSVDTKEVGLVNLFVSVPYYDPYWLGNLKELEKLLTDIGLKVNTIFGHNRGVENLKRVPSAEYNILVSPWTSLETVKFLEKKFGTPYLHYPVLPIGAFETSKFLRKVAEFTNLDTSKVEKVINEKEAEFYYYIERFADTFLEARAISNRFVVASDSVYTLGITKFLVNDMGMFPTKQFILDDTPQQYRQTIIEEFKNLNYGIKAEVEFSTDGKYVHDEISKQDFNGPAFIFGSSWEKDIADKLKANYLNISYPVVAKIIMNSYRVGYDGGLHLIEDIYTEALQKLIL